MSEPLFSVIIPCFNEEGAILDTLASLRKWLAEAGPYELIVVDDGSTDGTAAILASAEEADADLRVVRHPRNLGYGAALKTGIRRAEAPLIAITDADGTYPNDRLPELITRAADADMVVGARIGEDVVYSKVRAVPKIVLRRYASWLSRVNIPDINSGMRVFRKDVAERFIKVLPDTFSFTTTITVAMLTNRYAVDFVPISYAPRIGKSKIRPIRDTLKFVQLLIRTGMYFAPMRVLMPVVLLLTGAFLARLSYDVFVLMDLTEATMLLLLFALNTALFGLLADMIDKRSAG
jgi:glycosyltransferase involved in cell wall biosynthesis